MPPVQPVSSNTFDVIVIGVGSMGSAACYFLARQGHSVLGLEQFTIPHEQGSYTGQSRIIRKAYFEHPDYVPLLNKAYENWKDLETATGTQIYYPTGLLYLGRPDAPMIQGVKRSASLFDIPVQNLPASSAAKQFPQFKILHDFETLFEPDAGFIVADNAVMAYQQLALQKGAVIHTEEKLLEWKKQGKEIIVRTTKNSYRCSKLVITAGAWTGKILPALNDKIKVTRQLVAWINTRQEEDFRIGNFPCWLLADDQRPGAYYGFPALPFATFGGPGGMKLAHHHPGALTDPDQVHRQTLPQDIENLQYALNKYLPGAFSSLRSVKTCLYANTPDENFIIDILPGYDEQVVVAGGFSGHGFKFASAAGEILAELAATGSTAQPVDFLSLKRFSGVQ